jgi:hypothetical protein
VGSPLGGVPSLGWAAARYPQHPEEGASLLYPEEEATFAPCVLGRATETFVPPRLPSSVPNYVRATWWSTLETVRERRSWSNADYWD